MGTGADQIIKDTQPFVIFRFAKEKQATLNTFEEDKTKYPTSVSVSAKSEDISVPETSDNSIKTLVEFNFSAN